MYLLKLPSVGICSRPHCQRLLAPVPFLQIFGAEMSISLLLLEYFLLGSVFLTQQAIAHDTKDILNAQWDRLSEAEVFTERLSTISIGRSRSCEGCGPLRRNWRMLQNVLAGSSGIQTSSKKLPPSSVGPIRERRSEKNAAVEMLMFVVQFLEAEGLRVSARALVVGDVEFKELLRPVRAGTCIRNCRL